MEIAAVLLLAVGGLVFLPAWIAGVILLWTLQVRRTLG